jgi:hypothetical protein
LWLWVHPALARISAQAAQDERNGRVRHRISSGHLKSGRISFLIFLVNCGFAREGTASQRGDV